MEIEKSRATQWRKDKVHIFDQDQRFCSHECTQIGLAYCSKDSKEYATDHHQVLVCGLYYRKARGKHDAKIGDNASQIGGRMPLRCIDCVIEFGFGEDESNG